MNAVSAAPRHFLGLLDHSTSELNRILDFAETMKGARTRANRRNGVRSPARRWR